MRFVVLLWCVWVFPLVACGGDKPDIFPAQGTVQIAFTPENNIEGLLQSEIARSKKQILVQAYLLTSRAISNSLIAAHRRGIDVRVLADRNKVFDPSGHSRIPDLHRAGIPIWLEVNYAIAHNKILLIDAETDHSVVITGSYNFTASAQRRNAENVVIFRGHRPIAQRYASYWARHQQEALPYSR